MIAELERGRKVAPRARRGSTVDGRKTAANSKEFFGHPWPFWFQMRDAGYAHLASCARQRQMTTYGETWEAVARAMGEEIGNPWRQEPHLLGHIAEHVHDEIGLIPTAIVVHESGDDHPGAGFFRLAVAMGLLSDEHAPPEGDDWQMTPAQDAFWRGQVEAMFEQFAP